jgi:nitrogen fixation protein NifX
MKVAFTSSTGEMIDLHFGMADCFHIWEIGPEDARFLETVAVGQSGTDEEDKISSRVAVLTDCAIVYTMQIGGPAAAKVVASKVHPMKTGKETSIAEIVEKLQEVLRGNPPPWLRKAMNKENKTSFMED